MKINIISGLYQNETCSTGGVFVYERLRFLHLAKLPFEVWFIQNQYSPIIKFIYRLLKSRRLDDTVIPWDLDEKQHIIPIHITLPKLFFRCFIPKYYCQSVIKILESKITLDTSSIIHVHWVFPHGYIATTLSKMYHIPCIVTAHGSDIHTIPKNNKQVKHYTLKTLNDASKVIFVSHALLDSALSLGYSGDNSVVIPNGIDPKYFFPMTKEEALKKTGWKQTHKYVVGFVGHLIPIKRADKFVEIFSQIQQRVCDVEFIIIGDGFLKETIHTECEHHNIHVTFTGKIPHENVCSWMNLFDVMIFPSRNESWGCVIIESYACGIPVVGSANGGIPEALGGLCPSVPDGFDFEARFAEAVCDVLTGKIAINRENLVSWALEHTWEMCINREIAIYQQLLNMH